MVEARGALSNPLLWRRPARFNGGMPRSFVTLASALVLTGVTLAAPGGARGEEDAAARGDFEFFVARIAPILEARCASCHADRRKRGRGHALRSVPGSAARMEDHRANYRTVLSFVDPDDPAASVWLRSAIGKQQGGLSHGGGGVIRVGSPDYRTMVAFLEGETLLPERAPKDDAHPLGRDGLVLAATEATVTEGVEGEGQACQTGFLRVGTRTRTLAWRVVADEEARWRLTFRVSGWGTQARVRIDGRHAGTFRIPFGGFGNAGARKPMSAGERFHLLAGSMSITKGVVYLEKGDGETSGFLVPADVEHHRVEADVLLPNPRAGGIDALLLVGARSLDDAAFAGLLEGGRVLAMGWIEEGAMRVVASTRLDAPARSTRHRLGLRWGDRAFEAQLDGTTRLEAPLTQPIEAGRFGLRTAGHLQVHALEAFEAGRVYEASFTREPVVRLTRGTHTIELVTADGVPEVDRMVLRPWGSDVRPGEALTVPRSCVRQRPDEGAGEGSAPPTGE